MDLAPQTAARTLGEWAQRINAALGSAVAAIVATGAELGAAKAALPHGAWEKLFRDHPQAIAEPVRMTARTARRFMAIAAHPVLANRPHVSVLPPSWSTLYELTRLNGELLTAALADGRITPETERTDVYALARRVPTPVPALPAGTFAVLYADPPWPYECARSPSRVVTNHYPTMSYEAICALPVAAIAAPDATLFLWATSPQLEDALQVVRAWGFTYRTSAVWAKPQVGMGFYFRVQHEFLLVAVRGTPGVPEEQHRPPSVLAAPRGRHSEKPEQIYDYIEAMYPDVPRVELFARRARTGWTAWGNEVAT
jgi:N6-adenosine-specific RNA methylase IME4